MPKAVYHNGCHNNNCCCLISEGRAECTKWLALGENIDIKLQLSSDTGHLVEPRRSSSFIGTLCSTQHRKLQ